MPRKPTGSATEIKNQNPPTNTPVEPTADDFDKDWTDWDQSPDATPDQSPDKATDDTPARYHDDVVDNEPDKRPDSHKPDHPTNTHPGTGGPHDSSGVRKDSDKIGWTQTTWDYSNPKKPKMTTERKWNTPLGWKIRNGLRR